MNSFSETIDHTITQIRSSSSEWAIEGQPSAAQTGEERESLAVQLLEASEDRYLEENYNM